MFAHILVIGWMFTAGWVPIDNIAVSKTSTYDYTSYSYLCLSQNSGAKIGMSFNALFVDHINLRGDIQTWQTPLSVVNWSPYRIYYNVGADVSLMPYQNKDFNILVSIDRSCSHPIYGWGVPIGNTDTCYCEIKLSLIGTKEIF